MRPLYEHCKISRCIDSVAAGQAATTGDTIDTAGFDSITFICAIGAVTATGTVTMKIQQGAASDMSDAADLSGATAAATSDDDEGLLVVEVWRPRERYVRCIVTTATANGEIDGVIALLRDPQEIPVTQTSDVITYTTVSEPAES